MTQKQLNGTRMFMSGQIDFYPKSFPRTKQSEAAFPSCPTRIAVHLLTAVNTVI